MVSNTIKRNFLTDADFLETEKPKKQQDFLTDADFQDELETGQLKIETLMAEPVQKPVEQIQQPVQQPLPSQDAFYTQEDVNLPYIAPIEEKKQQSLLDISKAYGGLKTGAPILLKGLGGLARKFEETEIPFAKDIYNLYRKQPKGDTLKAIPEFSIKGLRGKLKGDYIAPIGKKISDYANLVLDDIYKEYDIENATLPNKVLFGTFSSIAQQLPAMATANPALILGSMGTNTFATTYADAKDKGMTNEEATAMGLFDGIIEVATEMTPVGKLLGESPNIFKKILDVALAEVPGEMVATITQRLNESINSNPDLTLNQIIKETFIDTPLQAILQSALMGGGVQLLQKGIISPTQQAQPLTDADFQEQTAQEQFQEVSPVELQQQATAKELMAQEQAQIVSQQIDTKPIASQNMPETIQKQEAQTIESTPSSTTAPKETLIEKVVKKAGAEYKGIQETVKGENLILFNDPKTNSTFSLLESEVNLKNVKNKLKESEVKYAERTTQSINKTGEQERIGRQEKTDIRLQNIEQIGETEAEKSLIEEAKKYKTAEEFVASKKQYLEKNKIINNKDFLPKTANVYKESNYKNHLDYVKEFSKNKFPFKNIKITRKNQIISINDRVEIKIEPSAIGYSATFYFDDIQDLTYKKDNISTSAKTLKELENKLKNNDKFFFGTIGDDKYLLPRNYFPIEKKFNEDLIKIDKTLKEEIKEITNIKINKEIKNKLSDSENKIAEKISQAWEYNKLAVHGYGATKYNFDRLMYEEKENTLKDAINMIEKTNPKNIDYGVKDNIIYFNVLGRQVSFHIKNIQSSKKFSGEWIGRKTEINPLTMSNNEYEDFVSNVKAGDYTTKQQLTDIWNEANKAKVQPKPTPKPEPAQKPKVAEIQEEKLSGIKKELVPEEYQEKYKQLSQTIPGVIQQGKDAIDNGEIDPNELIYNIINNAHAPSPIEVAGLIYHKAKLDKETAKANLELEKAQESGIEEKIEEAKGKLDYFDTKIEEFSEMIEVSAELQGLALVLRKALLNSSYDLQYKIRQYKKVNNGEIDKSTLIKFQQYDAKIKELQKQIAENESKKEENATENILKEVKKRIKKKDTGLKGKDLIAEGFEELLKSVGAIKSIQGEVSPKAISALSKIGKGLIDEGIATINNVIEKINKYLKDKNVSNIDANNYKDKIKEEIAKNAGIVIQDGKAKISNKLIENYVLQGIDNIDILVERIKKDYSLDMTEREIRDSITGYGRESSLTKNEMLQKINSIKRTGRLLSALDDITKKAQRPFRSKKSKAILDERQANLKKRIKEELSKLELTEEEQKAIESEKREKKKERLIKKIEEYRERIKKGDYSKKTREKVELDREGNRLEIELALEINKFDTEIEKRARKNRSLEKKTYDFLLDLWSAPRGFRASGEISGRLRQGGILTIAHPIKGLKAFGIMLRSTVSENKHDAWLNELKNTPQYILMKKSGLYLGELNAKLAAREEEIMSTLPERIPIIGKYIIKPSNRAFLAYLNALKVSVFNQEAQALQDMGYDTNKNIKQYKDLAKFINNATGRGSLGKLEGASTFLNSTFFSARFLMSRLQLLSPRYYLKMSPGTRRYVFKTMLKFLGYKMTMLFLLSLVGGDIEKDPTSPDFAKVRFGKFRFDLWTGFQQPIRHLFNFITGKKKDISTGMYRKINRWEVPWNFALTKISPSTGYLKGFLTGKGFDRQEFQEGEEFVKLFIPLAWEQIYEVAKKENAGWIALTGYTTFNGIGFDYYEQNDPILAGIENKLKIEDIIANVKKIKGNLPKSTETIMRKKFKAFTKFNMDDKYVHVFFIKGFTNEEKAQYLIDEKVPRERLNKYFYAGIVSSDLINKYLELSRKKGG